MRVLSIGVFFLIYSFALGTSADSLTGLSDISLRKVGSDRYGNRGCVPVSTFLSSPSNRAYVTGKGAKSEVYSIGSYRAITAYMTNIRNSVPDDKLPDYGTTSVNVDQHQLESRSTKWRRPDLFGTSIIEQTKAELASRNSQRLVDSAIPTSKEERFRRRRALDHIGITSFNQFLMEREQDEEAKDKNQITTESRPQSRLYRKQPRILQLNIGLYCNQACSHCHVESSPLRTEMMSISVVTQCLELLKNTPSIDTLDITGGAPELNAHFRYLVSMARDIRPDGLDIIDRCNLTVLQEPGQEDLIDFLVKNKVHVIASLPCYSEENVDKQRGTGVFDRSVSALLALNDVGYGRPSSGLVLDLVYNPLGAFLPPEQKKLEEKYKEVLRENFGIVFNSLFTITNMPIKRFADFLYQRGELKQYMDLLVRNFNLSTVDKLMCTDTISVGYDGKLYDCDFNQQLGYTIGKTVFDHVSLDELKSTKIRTDNHCFGCTAGMGSSCQGTTV